MPLLSPKRASVAILTGLPAPHRGKVRDTYDLGNGLLLVVATDGISIFDFVLNALVPEKGLILMAMTHFWLMKLKQFGIRTHFVAAGAEIDSYIPEHLRNDPLLQSRSMVVRKLTMDSAEFIGRVVLTGSILKEYLKSGTANGLALPPGLQDGDLFPYILDTPTTKADIGHDEALDAIQMRGKYPQQTLLLIQLMQIIAGFAKTKGIFFADSKFEMGVDEDGILTLGDEVGTPDSSRFWDLKAWEQGRKAEQRKAPPPFDKQLVRQWGIEQGISDSKKFDPAHSDDVARVHAMNVPHELIEATTKTYRYIFWRLTGKTIEHYLETELGVTLPKRIKRIDIVFGSESDIEGVKGVLSGLMTLDGIRVHVVSCHRNPDDLHNYVMRAFGTSDADVIIAAGGMAFALPGVLDAQIYASGQRIPVIGVALGSDLTTPQVSISQLPGQPVIMDEINGCVYSGKEGLRAALERVLTGELPPPKVRVAKPAKFEIDPYVLM